MPAVVTGIQEATVLVAYGSHGVVQVGDGAPVACLFRRRVGRPCCGDRVRIGPTDDGAFVVEELLPRRNQFMRADQRGRPHPIAANLDRVLVVIAVAPMPSRDLLDRYLVAVHSLELEPVIVVNKVELPVDGSAGGAATFEHLPHYEELGYTLARTSCKTAPGVDALASVVSGRTSIFVGQSGVGKSSLVRRLVPDLELQTGALSRVTGKGTHTTTTTQRYALPEGGYLVDSPGVWEYGLWRLDPEQIAHGYVEFRPLLGHCRFNDCRHHSEPGCAVKAAVEAGSIRPWRFESYLRLLDQNEAAA